MVTAWHMLDELPTHCTQKLLKRLNGFETQCLDRACTSTIQHSYRFGLTKCLQLSGKPQLPHQLSQAEQQSLSTSIASEDCPGLSLHLSSS